MLNNRLKLNDAKTQLLVVMPGSKNHQNVVDLVSIRTGSETINPCQSAKLLGCWVSGDLKWTEHIRNNSDNLLTSLNKRAAAVGKICQIATFRTRKTIAEGIFISKLSYLIVLWGGCGSVLRKSLQISQNKVARMVTKLPWMTPTSVLLKQCGWLSVNQLTFYHSVLLVFKVRLQKSPKYLFDMHKENEHNYMTRQAENRLLMTQRPRLELSKESYRWRSAEHFNQIPKQIRDSVCVKSFKREIKSWILANIPV